MTRFSKRTAKYLARKEAETINAIWVWLGIALLFALLTR